MSNTLTKNCKTCLAEKSVDDFYEHRHECKKCTTAVRRFAYYSRPEVRADAIKRASEAKKKPGYVGLSNKHTSEYTRNRRKTMRGWCSIALSEVRQRAKEKGLPFNLLLVDLVSVWPDSGKCPVLHLPLKPGDGRTDDSPSVDRIIPELGYVKGNVAIVSWRANKIKNNATLGELVSLADWLRGKIETVTHEPLTWIG